MSSIQIASDDILAIAGLIGKRIGGLQYDMNNDHMATWARDNAKAEIAELEALHLRIKEGIQW